MYRIVYMSKSSTTMTDFELDDIREKAVYNNPRLGLTGILVYVDNTFFQVLEGPQRAVEEIYSKVYLDPRHHRARILQQRAVSERRFANWNMGFCRLSDTDANAEAFFELSRNGFSELIPDAASDDLVKVMESFAETKLSPTEPVFF